MAKIAIIKSTGSSNTDLVMAGTYGSIVRSGEGETAKRVFQVDPEIASVHTIFEALQRRLPAMTADQAPELDIPEGSEHVFKAQILASMRNRWAGLYASMSAKQRGNEMLQVALEGEGLQVTRKVDAILDGQGLRAWSVPVKATMSTNADGAYLIDESRLLSALSPQSAKLVSVSGDFNGVQPIELASVLPQPDVEQNLVNPEITAQISEPVAWGSFAGVEADVAGTMTVVARDQQSAVAAAHLMIQVDLLNPGRFALAITPTEVLATRELFRSNDADSEMESGFDEDDDLGSYTFELPR